MWRPVGLAHPFLPLISIATFWCVVHAQHDTDGPCHTCPVECVGRRYWWRTMWGFIVTLVVLTMDVWGHYRSLSKSTIGNVLMAFLVGVCNPVDTLCCMLEGTVVGMAMLGSLREVLGDDLIAPKYPWSKSHIKIIVGSNVIVNLSPEVHNEVYNLNSFLDDSLSVEDFSEALVIGPKVKNSEQFNVQLSKHGQLALLRSNVLPPYDELKFLRGHSSLGMTIAAAQAMGYIYGVVVRCVQGLRVSPIEAIACVLNIVILMKGVLHNFTSLGHRPLLLYLLPSQEAKFIEECKNVQPFEFKIEGQLKLAKSIACGILLAVGAYYIVNFVKSLSRTCVVPIVLIEVGLVFGGIYGSLLSSLSKDFSFATNLLVLVNVLNQVGYVKALVVSFKYWKAEEFDVQSSNYLSQVLPYIG